MNGKTAIQGAPARISRGMPLPEVECDGDQPYVLCTRHPNGAVAVGTLPRVKEPREIIYPLADVRIIITDPDKPVGIFGRFKSLTLIYAGDETLDNMKLFAQDLAGERAIDITGRVTIEKERIIIPGDVIETSGLMAATGGDLSEPAMVLEIVNESGYK